MGDLANLEILNLSVNGLSGEIPAALESLTRLQELYLNHNPQLTGTIPPELENLAQLRAFYVHGTGLCVLPGSDLQTWLATIDFQGRLRRNAAATPTPSRSLILNRNLIRSQSPILLILDHHLPAEAAVEVGGGGPRTSAPEAPGDLTAALGDGQVVLAWSAPASDGGAAITDYEYRIDGRNPWISTGSTDTTHTVTGLVNGTTYTFQVRAVNRIGGSRASNQAEATPIAPVTLDLRISPTGTASPPIWCS